VQSALRFIVDGKGAYTTVGGERTTMYPGDFIITPSWTWHDHGNPGGEPVVWLDGLDIPLVRFFDCGFAENLAQEEQPVSRPEGDALARYGNNLLPIDYQPAHSASPVFAYPYSRTRETLEQLKRNGPAHPAHGHKLQFINPATGGFAMPTIAAFVQLLPAGFTGQGYRCTDGTVFHCIEGSGKVTIEQQTFAFGARDTFVVPSWMAHRFETAGDCVLFSFSDRPVQRALSVWREALVA
jgi:gentisate 1,2-dioxygenase